MDPWTELQRMEPEETPEPERPPASPPARPHPAEGLEIRTLLEALEGAGERSASDVLVTAHAPLLWRVAGQLVEVSQDPLDGTRTQAEVYGLLTQEQIGRLETERELDFSLRLASGLRFRANAYWQRGSLAASFRLVPARVPSLEQLGLPAVVATITREPQGLVLVTGPTGHGKSTTLAAMIDHINHDRRAHVITIEDPIEYEHRHDRCIIDQRELGSDTTSFAEALRRVLRQSPDIIMVGEMRDRETIGAALTAAETGHLVLATLHTNDAAQSVDRVIDVFPPEHQSQVRGQLSHCLEAVISQRLLPRADGDGLALACEVLIATPGVRHMIRDDKVQGILTAIETGTQHGMVTMDGALRALVRAGTVSREEAVLVAREPRRIP